MKLTASVTRIDHGMDAFRKRLEVMRLHKSYVKAGVLGNGKHRDGKISNAELASIHEYGLGNVPARPFIGPPFRVHKPTYLQLLRDGYSKAMKNNSPEGFRKLLALVGQKMVADIRNYVTQGSGIPPPLALATTQRKGSSRPLVDTGQLVNSISYEVVE